MVMLCFVVLLNRIVISLLAGLMMIDLNGPDIEAVDEVKEVIMESVNAWKNSKKRMLRFRQGSVQV